LFVFSPPDSPVADWSKEGDHTRNMLFPILCYVVATAAVRNAPLISAVGMAHLYLEIFFFDVIIIKHFITDERRLSRPDFHGKARNCAVLYLNNSIFSFLHELQK
jgi:hypothetical protein